MSVSSGSRDRRSFKMLLDFEIKKRIRTFSLLPSVVEYKPYTKAGTSTTGFRAA